MRKEIKTAKVVRKRLGVSFREPAPVWTGEALRGATGVGWGVPGPRVPTRAFDVEKVNTIPIETRASEIVIKISP